MYDVLTRPRTAPSISRASMSIAAHDSSSGTVRTGPQAQAVDNGGGAVFLPCAANRNPGAKPPEH